jgi:alpha-D-ribose 1-methylphosphonate 5-triphosphate synthase subunit PhnH
MHANQIIKDHYTFRLLLQAMARPGSVLRVMEPSEHEHPALRLLSCITDNEVGICSVGAEAQEIGTALCRHQGCRMTGIQDADFIIVSGGTSLGKLTAARPGTLEYPDSGATILYLIERIAHSGGTVVLSGPGIRETATPAFTGLDPAELLQLQTLNSAFPLGVDTIFVDREGQCTCIPRSTVIQVN